MGKVDRRSSSSLLKGYFNRKPGVTNTWTCRLCQKDLKAPQGLQNYVNMLTLESNA